ncbi:MAG: MBL fold metallo-hydrolase [Lachnospiraceae bacterium]|nr:MBL fold metallo-hydrolase [Lachnospiraceae bacterium]
MAEIIQINENTWRIEDGMVRFFVFEGEERALLIDSGMNTPDAAELAGSVTSKPLSMLNTHADRDHISGNGAFDKCYMSPDEEANFREAGGSAEIIPIREGDIIDLGNRPLEIIDIPGHTPGSVAILDIGRKALVSGDSVQNGNIFMFGKYRSFESYIKSLNKLLTYRERFDTIYPSHGSFPVEPDLIGKLIGGAERIVNGQAEGKIVDMFGRQAKLFKFDFAGFLCEAT